MAYLGWPDDAIMDCDLARLNMAVAARVKAIDDERKFQAWLHDKKFGPEKPKPISTKEFNDRARASFVGLKTTVVKRTAKAA